MSFGYEEFYQDNLGTFTAPQDIYEHELVFEVDEGQFTIVVWMVPYIDKQHFLFHQMIDMEERGEGWNYELLDCTKANLGEQNNRVIQCGFESTGMHQMQLSNRSRVQVIQMLTRFLRHLLATGYKNLIAPDENLVLQTHALGQKNPFHLTEQSNERGGQQRALFAQRLGFGPVQKDEYQYAMYDANKKLQALNKQPK